MMAGSSSSFVDSILPWETIGFAESAVEDSKISDSGHQDAITMIQSINNNSSRSTRGRRNNKLQLIFTVLSFRFIYLFTMSLSCHFIPDHNPGDDVLRFNMRLLDEIVKTTANTTNNNGCFCLSGDVCERLLLNLRIIEDDGNDNKGCSIHWNDIIVSSDNTKNATVKDGVFAHERNSRSIRSIWQFILSPLTKWDAARFLTLAVRPNIRDPYPSLSISSTLTSTPTPMLQTSEQAHAFFPMFPYVIRTLALWYVSSTPTWLRPFIVPPTFEGLITFVGLLFNNVFCCIVIVLCMYELTVMLCDGDDNDDDATNDGGRTQKRTKDSIATITKSRQMLVDNIAWTTCIVIGLWNPAAVFFSSNYSESFFCALTLFGHVCMQKNKRRARQQRQLKQQQIRERHSRTNWSGVLGVIWWWSLAIVSWMVASYTRSNGTIHCLWLIQDAIAKSIVLCSGRQHQSWTSRVVNVIPSILTILGQCLIGVAAVAFPVRYHDWVGYNRHCNPNLRSLKLEPDWCRQDLLSTSSTTTITTSDDDNTFNFFNVIFGEDGIFRLPFSLYAYVQDRHWNVGLCRYYTWNQIPNFLLATPIMILCFAGVYAWIYWSLVVDYGRGKMPRSLYMILFGWPLYAFPESVSFSFDASSSTETRQRQQTLSPISTSVSSLLVTNPRLLGHYAILAILGVVGLLIAHIQISTRMICSSSPALWWFMTFYLSKRNSSDVSKLVWYYCLLFMILGVILHVNFLPWT